MQMPIPIPIPMYLSVCSVYLSISVLCLVVPRRHIPTPKLSINDRCPLWHSGLSFRQSLPPDRDIHRPKSMLAHGPWPTAPYHT